MRFTNITLLPASRASARIHRPMPTNALRANSPIPLRFNHSVAHMLIVPTLAQEAAK